MPLPTALLAPLLLLLTALAAADEVASLTAPWSRAVFQRDGSGYASIPVEGTYAGSPSAIQARAVAGSVSGISWAQPAGTPALADWATLTSLTISGGTFRGRLRVPAGGWYVIEARAGGSGTVRSVSHIGVGEVFIMTGQSNMLSGDVTSVSDRASKALYSGFVLANPPRFVQLSAGGNGVGPSSGQTNVGARLADRLSASHHIPVLIVNASDGGVSVEHFRASAAAGGTTNPYASFKQVSASVVSRLGGFRAVLWHQGENDGLDRTSQLVYAQTLRELLGFMRADAGLPGLPLVTARASGIAGPGPISDNSSEVEPRDLEVEMGQTMAAALDSGIFAGPLTDDIERGASDVHYTPAGAAVHGERFYERVVTAFFSTPIVTIEASAPTVVEGGSASYVVRRTGATTADLSVQLSTTGSASTGSDYTAPASVTIPAGQTSATVTIAVSDDAEPEGVESIGLQVVDAAAYDLEVIDIPALSPKGGSSGTMTGNASALVRIATSDASPVTIIANASVLVGSDASRESGATVNVQNNDGASDRQWFLRFSLASVSGTIRGATLRYYDSTGTSVYGVADHATDLVTGPWDPASLSWASRPAVGARLDLRANFGTGWREIEVTGYAVAGGTLSVRISQPWQRAYSGGEYRALGYGGFEPELVIVTGVSAPEVAVEGNGVGISDGATAVSAADHTDFGSTVLGTPVVRTFTVRNLGSAALSLSNLTSSASAFSVGSFGQTTLAGGGSTTFTVSYAASAAGAHGATITFGSNDSDENPFSFAVSGTTTVIAVPEIDVDGQGLPIANGDLSPQSADGTDFGTVVVGGSLARAFVVHNRGTAALTISSVASSNARFAVTGAPTSIAGGANASFTVTFAPTAPGAQTATVTIVSTDSDEGSYQFGLAGVGSAAPQPDLSVLGNSVVIAAGDVTPSPLDHTRFPATTVGTAQERIFRLRNGGTSDLQITSVTVSGSDFTVTPPAQLVLNPGFNPETDLRIGFPATAAGTFTASVIVVSTDPDQPSYTFTISATSTASPVPEIELRGQTLAIVHGDLTPRTADGTDFGAVAVGASLVRTFTIHNLGSAALTVTAVATSNTRFVVSAAPTSVAVGGSASFTVTFSPIAGGAQTATLTITSDDADEASYQIGLAGLGAQPDLRVLGSGIEIAAGDATPQSGDLTRFPDTSVGTAQERVFRLRNAGNADLQVTSVSVSGGGFILTPPAVLTLAPAAETDLRVRFPATTLGTFTATVTVVSDDPGQPSHGFAVSATAALTTVPSTVPVDLSVASGFTPGNGNGGCAGGSGLAMAMMIAFGLLLRLHRFS